MGYVWWGSAIMITKTVLVKTETPKSSTNPKTGLGCHAARTIKFIETTGVNYHS
jgi:hypothetical protein